MTDLLSMVLEIFFDNKISIIFSLRNCFRKNIYQECWCFYKSFISGKYIFAHVVLPCIDGRVTVSEILFCFDIIYCGFFRDNAPIIMKVYFIVTAFISDIYFAENHFIWIFILSPMAVHSSLDSSSYMPLSSVA